MNLMQFDFTDRVLSGNIIPTIDWGGLVGPLMTVFANFILYGVILLLLWMFVINPLRFKDEVEVRKMMADGKFVIKKDRGRFVRNRKTDEVKYQLLKNKRASIPVFSGSEYYYPMEKGKNKLYMIMYNEVDIRPIHPHELESSGNPMSLHRRNALINNLTDIEKMFEKDSLIKQYMPYLVLVVMTVFFWLAFRSMMDGFTGAALPLADSMRYAGDKVASLAPYLEQIIGSPPAPPP